MTRDEKCRKLWNELDEETKKLWSETNAANRKIILKMLSTAAESLPERSNNLLHKENIKNEG